MGKYRKYPASLKESALKRYFSGGLRHAEVATEFDVVESTFSNWVSEAQDMTKKNHKKRTAAKSKDGRSPQEKFHLLLEAAALSEAGKGEFLRRHGLRDGDLERWEREALSGLGDSAMPPAAEAQVKLAERKAAKSQARLREAEALLELQKKFQALWVDRAEDDEPNESAE